MTQNNPFLAFNNEDDIYYYIHVTFIRVITIYTLVDRPVPVILRTNTNQRIILMNSHYPDTTTTVTHSIKGCTKVELNNIRLHPCI